MHQHKNPLIVSSIRLMTPTLDLFAWRDRASKAQSPSVEKYKWSSNNSLMGKIEEEKEGVDEGDWKANKERLPTARHRRDYRGRSYEYRKDKNGRSYRHYFSDDSSSSRSSSSRLSGYHLSLYFTRHPLLISCLNTH